MPRTLSFLVCCSALAALPATSLVACGSASATAGGGAGSAAAARPETIDHEDCKESGNRVDLLDANNDGKPDIRAVYDKGSGRPLCRIVDLNHDGRPDLFDYYDASGQLRRREYAFGEDGVINAIEEYQAGKLAKREYDTTGQHKLDTWDTFDPSRPPDRRTGRPTPARRERDTTGDGHIDQWWEWAPDGTITIFSDKTGSGRPDPASKLVIEAGAPPPPTQGQPDGGASPAATPADTGDASAPMATDAATGAADGGAR